MRKILLTFGCSWTKGIGAGYEEGMPNSEFRKIVYDQTYGDAYSFRTILSKKYGFENINYSQGGSSNQLQFIKLKQFFTSDEFKNFLREKAEIIVLHGLTSTARAFLYDNRSQGTRTFMFNNEEAQNDSALKNYIMNFYDHNFEIERLTEEIQFTNNWYEAMGIKNLWFDTFNSHTYTGEIENFIGKEYEVNRRDMLTRMSILNGISDIDNNYHVSTWKVDTNRVKILVDTKHLNPFSIHPTKLGHQLIADIISKDLEKIL